MGFNELIGKLFGNKNTRDMREIQPWVDKVKKAYPAYFDTYAEMDTLIAYLSEIENLYCIGRNGQHRYNNMDHSMLTAIRAAEVIAAGGGDKTAIWNVNTEQEYHEEKKN